MDHGADTWFSGEGVESADMLGLARDAACIATTSDAHRLSGFVVWDDAFERDGERRLSQERACMAWLAARFGGRAWEGEAEWFGVEEPSGDPDESIAKAHGVFGKFCAWDGGCRGTGLECPASVKGAGRLIETDQPHASGKGE